LNSAPCHANDFITWQFHVGHKDVTWVEIRFGDKKEEHYFAECPKPWKCTKPVDPTTRRVLIYGKAPGTYPNGPKYDKYTIRGYDGDPSATGTNRICELDPEIVVDTP
jgi:hypothetical protein